MAGGDAAKSKLAWPRVRQQRLHLESSRSAGQRSGPFDQTALRTQAAGTNKGPGRPLAAVPPGPGRSHRAPAAAGCVLRPSFRRHSQTPSAGAPGRQLALAQQQAERRDRQDRRRPLPLRSLRWRQADDHPGVRPAPGKPLLRKAALTLLAAFPGRGVSASPTTLKPRQTLGAMSLHGFTLGGFLIRAGRRALSCSVPTYDHSQGAFIRFPPCDHHLPRQKLGAMAFPTTRLPFLCSRHR